MHFYLKVFDSEAKLELYKLQKQFYFVGRANACHIKLDFKFISRCQTTLVLGRDNARFYYTAYDGSLIVKVPSSSGVYINKKRIFEGARLESGDMITFLDTPNIVYPYLEFIEESTTDELPTDSYEFGKKAT